MHLAALSKEKTNYSLRRFRQAAADLGVKWSRIDPSECILSLAGSTGDIRYHGKRLPNVDAFLTRRGSGIADLEITVVNQLERLGKPVLNGTYGLLLSRDKFWSLRRLADHDIPVPRTVVLNDPKDVEMAFKLVGEPPVVLKVLRGMKGVGVMIAESKKSVRSILDTFHSKDERILIQEFLATSEGRDTRVLVVGGKVITAMERVAEVGEFRSNIHRGGSGHLVKLDAEAKKVARQAAKTIGLDIAGVDLMWAEDGPRVVEVNSSPGFEGLEKATGMDIATLILQHAIDIAEGKAKGMARRLRLVDVTKHDVTPPLPSSALIHEHP